MAFITHYYSRLRDRLTRYGLGQANYTISKISGESMDMVATQLTAGVDAGSSYLELSASAAYIRPSLYLPSALQVMNTLGADVVVNGTFAADASWTKGTGWTISGGQALKASGMNTTTLTPSTALVPVLGVLYRLQYDIASFASGSITASFGGATGATKTANATGYIEYLLAADAESSLVFTPEASTALRLDNISLKAVGLVAADQVMCWVEDLNGTADKASLYFRTEDGTIHKFGPAATLSTAALTLLTHTAPSTPDYAVQALTQTTPFGFVTADEGNTVLKVVLNLQSRMAVLEAALTTAGVVV